MAEPLDTHLLRVLYLVLQEKSVSRAADRLGITQPAVSSALKRLREITGDDLLVRTRSGMTPTERAEGLIAPTQAALDAIDSILLKAEPFDPAKSLSLSFVQQLRLIVLPQATKIAIAPTVGFMVQVIKGTALASIIGFIEITKTGTMITNATFKPFLVYSFVALFYFALCFPLSWWSKRLELRMSVSER